MQVLLIEDDLALATFLRRGLELEGHSVQHAEHGEAGLAKAREGNPDLIVLDLNLPKLDGVEVLRRLRAQCTEAPVLVLTGRGSIEERVGCLDAGADDFLLKPFSFFELIARCRAILRRRVEAPQNSTLRFGALEVDRLARTVRVSDAEIVLTGKEFALLDYLLQNRTRAVSRPELLEKVWKMAPDAGTNVVDVYVNYLRRKLPIAGLIQTVRGSGYTLGSPAELSSPAHPIRSIPGAFEADAA